jgi:hypothetical protein
MNDWQSTYLGRGALPRDLSGLRDRSVLYVFESERRVIDDERRLLMSTSVRVFTSG